MLVSLISNLKTFILVFILSRHIENILLQHNCVIIPGFGGLMTQYVPARYIADESLFLPPHRSVSFNNRLVINDGMLVQSYMSAFAVNYADASARVEAAVADLKSILLREGEYKLHGIGTFRLSLDGEYTFQALEAGTLSPELYGLDSVCVKSIEQAQTQVEQPTVEQPATFASQDTVQTSDEKYYVLRLNKMFVNYMVASVVMLLCYFSWSVPVSTTSDVHVKQAAFFASDIFAEPTQDNLALAPRIVTEDTITGNQDVVLPSTYAQPQEQPANEPVVSEATKSYTIVVCSCVPRSNADKLVNSLSQRGIQAEIFVKQNILRVVVGAYASNAEAEQYLRTLKTEHEGFKEAWILKK